MDPGTVRGVMTSPYLEIPRYRVVPLPNPAAGAEIVVPMTGVGSWLILSVVFDLVTSVAAGNRLVSLTMDDGTNIYQRLMGQAAQAASLTNHYSAFIGSTGATAGGNVIPVDFPDTGAYLQAGSFLRTNTQSRDAGDQFSGLVLQVIEFPTGPDYLALPMPGYVMQPTG